MPPLENMAFPPFAGFPPCAICAASYAKNDAIGFKRDNAQLTMCGALSVKPRKGSYAVFKVQGVPLTARVWQTHYARCIFFPFDCKELEYLRCMYGACGAGPCPACLSGLLLSSFAIVSVVLVCLPARGKGPSSLPCVRTSGARSQYTRTGGKVHSFLNKKRKKNNIMTILQKVIF